MTTLSFGTTFGEGWQLFWRAVRWKPWPFACGFLSGIVVFGMMGRLAALGIHGLWEALAH